MDALGHGRSDAPATGYGREDRVDDVIDVLDELRIEKVHLVGLSMGGSTGIGLALRYEERLQTLTLASTGAAGYSVGKKIGLIDKIAKEQGLEPARERWMRNSLVYYKNSAPELGRLMETMMREHSGAIWLDKKRGKYPRLDDLSKIGHLSLPVHIVVGEKDQVFVKLANIIHEKLPDAHFTEFEGAGHMVNMEAPDRFNQEVLAFLADHTP